VFHVGQLPEVTAEPLPTSPKQILGKEGQSLRKRKRETGKEGGMMMGMEMSMSMAGPGAQSDVDDDEVFIKIPCTVNGQISSGSVDRFRFVARRGQRLVVTVNARTLVPYMADAVPGWFQPVLILCDAQGKELAYNDDYRFQPNPSSSARSHGRRIHPGDPRFDLPRTGRLRLPHVDRRAAVHHQRLPAGGAARDRGGGRYQGHPSRRKPTDGPDEECGPRHL
jgi:hypothetical protein